MSAEDVFIREQGSDGICGAYNRILSAARATPDCEGVILIHDDTQLGGGAREQILRGLRDSGVGLVGVVGGRELHGPIWVDARHRAGVANDTYGRRVYGPSSADVDVVDGLLLAIAPAAFTRLDFDQTTFPAFHAYDTDYCLQVRRTGLRVRVVPIDYRHVDKGDLGDRAAFDEGFSRLQSKWPDLIRSLSATEKLRLSINRNALAYAGASRHRLMSILKKLLIYRL